MCILEGDDSFVCASCQYTGSSSNMAVDDRHSILNYVLLVGANNYVQVQNDCFSPFFIERFFLNKC